MRVSTANLTNLEIQIRTPCTTYATPTENLLGSGGEDGVLGRSECAGQHRKQTTFFQTPAFHHVLVQSRRQKGPVEAYQGL